MWPLSLGSWLSLLPESSVVVAEDILFCTDTQASATPRAAAAGGICLYMIRLFLAEIFTGVLADAVPRVAAAEEEVGLLGRPRPLRQLFTEPPLLDLP